MRDRVPIGDRHADLTVGRPSATCPWCRLPHPRDAVTCPECGAPLDVRRQVSPSGWVELPPIRDMARIQLGRSRVQVSGTYVPVADFDLAPGEGVYFAHHVLLWRDVSVELEVMPGDGWTRRLAGLPVYMTEARGPGHIAFSHNTPGEMVAVPLEPRQGVDVREHAFVVATAHVGYGYFPTNVWWRTYVETLFPVGQYMDQFAAREQPGLVLLHAPGDVFVRNLRPGEPLLVKPTSLLYKDPSVAMQLHLEHPRGVWSQRAWWANRYVWLTLLGPGRVAVHSAHEGVVDRGEGVREMSVATERQW